MLFFSYRKQSYNKLSYFLNIDFWSKELYYTRQKLLTITFINFRKKFLQKVNGFKSNKFSLKKNKFKKKSIFFKRFIKQRCIKLSLNIAKNQFRNPFLNTYSFFESYENFFFIMKFNMIFLFLLLNRFSNFFFLSTKRVFDLPNISNYFVTRFDINKHIKKFFYFFRNFNVLKNEKNLDFFIFFRKLILFPSLRKPVKSFRTLYYFLNQKVKKIFYLNMSYYYDINLFKTSNPEVIFFVTSKTYSFFIRKILIRLVKKKPFNFFRKFHKKSFFARKFLLLKTFQCFYGKLKLNILKSYLLKTNSLFIGRLQQFLFFLESRLDVFLWRTNLFSSIFSVRQLILHNNVFVNNKLHNKYGSNLLLGQKVYINSFYNKNYYLILYRRLLSYLSDSFWFLSKIEHKNNFYRNFSVYDMLKKNLNYSFRSVVNEQNRSVFFRGFYSPVFFRFKNEATRFLDNSFLFFFRFRDATINNFVQLDYYKNQEFYKDINRTKNVLYNLKNENAYFFFKKKFYFQFKDFKHFFQKKLKKKRKFKFFFKFFLKKYYNKYETIQLKKQIQYSKSKEKCKFSFLLNLKKTKFVFKSNFNFCSIFNYFKKFVDLFIFFFFRLCLLTKNTFNRYSNRYRNKYNYKNRNKYNYKNRNKYNYKNRNKYNYKNRNKYNYKNRNKYSYKNRNKYNYKKKYNFKRTFKKMFKFDKKSTSVTLSSNTFFHVEIQKAVTCYLVEKIPLRKQIKHLLHFYLPIISLLRSSFVFIVNFIKYFKGFSFIDMFNKIFSLYRNTYDVFVFLKYKDCLNDLLVFFKTDVFIKSLKLNRKFSFIKPSNVIFIEDLLFKTKQVAKNIKHINYKLRLDKSFDILFKTIEYVLPKKKYIFFLFIEFSKHFDLLLFKSLIPTFDIYNKIKTIITTKVFVYTQRAALFKVIKLLKKFKSLRLHKNQIGLLVTALKEISFVFYRNISARKVPKRFKFLTRRFKRNIVKAHKDLHSGVLMKTVLTHLLSSEGQSHVNIALKNSLKFSLNFNFKFFLVDYLKLHTNIIKKISLKYSLEQSFAVVKYSGKVPRSNLGFLSSIPNYMEFNYSTMCGMFVNMPKKLEVPQTKVIKYKELLNFFV